MREESRPDKSPIQQSDWLLPAEPLMLAVVNRAIDIIIALTIGGAVFTTLPGAISVPLALAAAVGLSFVLHASTWHVITAVGIASFTAAWAGASFMLPIMLPEFQFRDTSRWQFITLECIVPNLVIDRLFRLRPPSILTRIATTVIVFLAALVLLVSWYYLEPAFRATAIAAWALYAAAVGYGYLRAWRGAGGGTHPNP